MEVGELSDDAEDGYIFYLSYPLATESLEIGCDMYSPAQQVVFPQTAPQCVFGKTQENLRKRVQVELITDVGILRTRDAKPNFCRGNPITDCLTAIQCTVATLTLNRPIYVEDIYGDMADMADMANMDDFSEYTFDHPLCSAMNRKAIGSFKDGLNSVPMQQFVGLHPKCYAFLCTGKVINNMLQHTNPVEKKTAKGAKRLLKDAQLQFAHSTTFIHISVERT